MTNKERYEKAQLLKAGQVVEIAGDWFRAIRINSTDILDTCGQCDLDSICRGDVEDVCCEMEVLEDVHWILKLIHA